MKLEEYLKSNYSSTSIKGYLNMIKRFKLVMNEGADSATYTDVLEYIGLLREQNLHPKSLRNNLFAIKIYFNYLLQIGKRNDHPCKYLYLKDQINRQIQVESLYSKETLEDLYQNHQSKKEENQRRDKIIISLLIYQALTVLEISQLKVDDVDVEAGTIFVGENKKNRERTLSLKPQQILLFHTYLKKDWKRYHRKQTPKKRLNNFILSENGVQIWKSGINRMINRGREKNEKLTPLKIRQSVIAHLLKENNDIRIVQAFAGHRRTASTEAYKQTGLEELKSAIEKLHPLQ
ncbi:MAG: tyrosine-type recombinase/integrase [Bacteroidota bacterium]